ncbi:MULTISPECIES: hypothetical protein [Photobacterium]|uniref:Uncharacterized protein n=1 Tax=Photobacterium carnosum TaxID=2023717 RepID=A0A2N4UPS6_9GAMM|nr:MULTISPECIES: hypothetical protein [Photobacterium]MBY3788989.1 hypothetical protein [Photobacterium carnosum]MCD9463353.1 hypothetical protein [Photobacterium phosphoreum]MCD9480134.1 hypothetical protein [Photobacterium phosphoreum]MCD9502257.1 hypothetical protein [Photobacterium phosphoreum]MCD9512480.1 hypothetical protein [Photobacterium phosphoreum]
MPCNKFNNLERLTVSMTNFTLVIKETSLALLFKVINNDDCNYKSIDFDSFISDLLSERSVGGVKAFSVTNPINGHIVAFYTDCNVVMPINLEAYDSFICSIAGFNTLGELRVLELMTNENSLMTLN